MAKFSVIVADPPYAFSDRLTMSSVKRGSASNYDTLSTQQLKELKSYLGVILPDDALLALWCPSALLKDGIEILEAWGFVLKQTHVWVKTKKVPFTGLIEKFKKTIKHSPETIAWFLESCNIIASEQTYPIETLNDTLAFGMGRIFRQTHEICLIGTKGRISKLLKNKSQRSVHFGPVLRHSAKPEALQDMLDQMFDGEKLELFARRERPGWRCL